MAAQPEMTAVSDPRPAGHNSSGMVKPAALLPTWESFATADRRRLVQTILHAAQQHLTTTQPDSTTALGR